MLRTELYQKIRAEMRAYRRSRPEWYRYDLSQWLLMLRSAQANALQNCNWTSREAIESYLLRMLGTAALCMEEHGVVTAGGGPPLERMTLAADSDLDLVFLTIDRGCEQQFPGSPLDRALRIDCCLRRAFDAQETPGNTAVALDAVRDVASLATLGLTNETQGD